jgi:hypothetical protein
MGMLKARYLWLTGARLALGAVLALGPRVCAQALETNSLPPRANQATPTVSVGPGTPFASSILDHPGVKLPEQGPWTVSAGDFNYPIPFMADLVEHNHPPFLFLWDSLSSETQSALEKDRVEKKMEIPAKLYTPDLGWQYVAATPGPALQDLVANLNRLIQGELIYNEQAFAVLKPYLSGDTAKLLNQPTGADVSRLNRLLLEDAFPLDIMRRPKILHDDTAQNYFFIDLAKKTVSLYGKDGNKKWTADLGPALAIIGKASRGTHALGRRDTSMIPVTGFNLGIFDVTSWPGGPGMPGTLLVEFQGREYGEIDLSTGDVRPIRY